MYLFINSCLRNRNITGRIYLKNSYLFKDYIYYDAANFGGRGNLYIILFVRTTLIIFSVVDQSRICVHSRAFLPRNTSSDRNLDRYHQNGCVFANWKQKIATPFLKKIAKNQVIVRFKGHFQNVFINWWIVFWICYFIRKFSGNTFRGFFFSWPFRCFVHTF